MGSPVTTDPHTEGWPPNRVSGGRLVPPSSSAGALPVHPMGASIAHAEASRNQRVTVLLPTPLIERLRNAIYWTEQRRMARVIADAIQDAVAEMEQANGGTFPPRLSPLRRGRPRRIPSPRGRPSTESSR